MSGGNVAAPAEKGDENPDTTSSKTPRNVRRLMHKKDQTYSHYAARKFKKEKDRKKVNLQLLEWKNESKSRFTIRNKRTDQEKRLWIY